MRRSLIMLSTVLLATACSEVSEPVGPQAVDGPAFAQSGGAQLQEYIVVFHDNVTDADGLARGLVDAHGGSLGFVYETALKGFSAALPEAAVTALGSNPNVDYIEPNGVVTTTTTQTGATWGLDRIDQRNLPLDGNYTYASSGGGVTAYIIDTGIRADHNEFVGRVLPGKDLVDNDDDPADCNGHGTHVAGTVGGTTYGVAKSVNLVGVRVLGCSGSGTYAGVIAGIDWVTANHLSPAVANMSLSGGASSSVDQAVRNSIAAGVVYAVAASNDDADACTRSPAREALALTAGATTSSDSRSSFSNWGTCVDIFAPGSSITSAGLSSPSATATYSGTSMASPHVAGVAALYLGDNPGASTTEVFNTIIASATPGIVSDPGTGSPNLLLHNVFTPAPPVTPTAVTVASLTVSTAGKKRVKGVASLRIEDSNGNGVAGATVSGLWSGDVNQADSGVTDSSGNLTLQSSNVLNGASFTFCVADVTGQNLEYTPATADCADSSSGGGGGGGGGEAGPLDNLNVKYKLNGKQRTTLTWTGGPDQVDISNSAGPVVQGLSNTGQWQGDGAPVGTTWTVCPAGLTEGCITGT